MTRLSIEQLKQVQREQDLLDTHLCSFDADGFTIAHTDEERAEAQGGGNPLDACPLVQAIEDRVGGLGDGIPEEPGEYTAFPHQADGYSESYRSDYIGWDFTRLRQGNQQGGRMTFEEMLAMAEQIARDLTTAGYGNAEVLRDDLNPGDPIPIAFNQNGVDFSLALDVL